MTLGRRRRRSTAALVAALAVAGGACSDDGGGGEVGTSGTAIERTAEGTGADVTGTDGQRFPDVVAVEATPVGGGAVRFDVTISSPYDSPERYADAWRVLAPDGTELGVRVLTHDHADEQPFTRSDTFDVPADVTEVTVEGRDLVNGWGGATATVAVPER